MQIRSSSEFEKDIRKLDLHERKRLKEIIEKLGEAPEMGKPLHHFGNLFSIRAQNRRLVYQFSREKQEVILLLYKDRDEVYQYLR